MKQVSHNKDYVNYSGQLLVYDGLPEPFYGFN